MSDFVTPVPPNTASEQEVVDFAAVLEELAETIERAKSMPLSSSVIISREEVLGLLDQAREAIPVEYQRARRLLRDREEVRQQALMEANELLDEARAQAAHLVQRTEVVRQARHQAGRLITDAEGEARRIRHEADDYVDRKLAAFEIVLDRTLNTVRAGRERLGAAIVVDDDSAVEDAAFLEGATGEDQGFFDQDTK